MSLQLGLAPSRPPGTAATKLAELADFYGVPLDPKQVADLKKQYVELFAEQDPDERAGSFDSLEAAIEAHDKDFVSETEGTG